MSSCTTSKRGQKHWPDFLSFLVRLVSLNYHQRASISCIRKCSSSSFLLFQIVPLPFWLHLIESEGRTESITMSAEFCWTRTSDHVRLAQIASRKSSCLAANFNQLQLVDPWANPTSSCRNSGLLICTGQPQADDDTTVYDYCSLAVYINSWLENLPTVPVKFLNQNPGNM